MKCEMSFALSAFGIIFCVMEVTSAPQAPSNSGQGGLIGVGNQWLAALLASTNAAAQGFSNGANTGFQSAGNTALDLFNGALGSYNSAADGLVNGFQSFVGIPRPAFNASGNSGTS